MTGHKGYTYRENTYANMTCDYDLGDDLLCEKPALYYVEWYDGRDWLGSYLCEEHFAEKHRLETGEYPPGYVDKDTRIAALTAQLTEFKRYADIIRTIEEAGKFNCKFEIWYEREASDSLPWIVQTYERDEPEYENMGHKFGSGKTIEEALVNAGLLPKDESGYIDTLAALTARAARAEAQAARFRAQRDRLMEVLREFPVPETGEAAESNDQCGYCFRSTVWNDEDDQYQIAHYDGCRGLMILAAIAEVEAEMKEEGNE